MQTLTPEQAKRFYDRFGARQDAQGFYEDAAVHKRYGAQRLRRRTRDRRA